MLAFIALGFVYTPRITYVAPQVAQVVASQDTLVTETKEEIEEKRPTELFFVGDIMLGRDVESRITEEGIEYPFAQVYDILKTPDITIGNFEGVIPEEHKKTPSMGFQFSIRNEYLTQLKKVGFDVLSLANNHSLDHGIPALMHTRAICKEIGIVCGGSPADIDRYATYTTEAVTGEKITFIFLHSLWSVPSDIFLDELFAQIDTESTLQIAYIHWGDEYVLTHNNTQQMIAEKMIDRGVDVVIGHHPHVVQDVGMYKGKPIFYSLGNFIFDQYFSEDVQEGLGVRMHIDDEYITYTLVPFTSKESRNQPRFMDDEGRIKIISRILTPIREYPGIDSVQGSLKVFR